MSDPLFGTLVLNTPLEKRHVEIDGGRVWVLGSGRSADICADDRSLPRKCLKFYRQQDVFLVESLNKDPIKINGENKVVALLRDGDLIEIGSTEVMFYYRQQAADGVSSSDKKIKSRSDRASLLKGLRKTMTALVLECPRLTMVLMEKMKPKVQAVLPGGRRVDLSKDITPEVEDQSVLLLNENQELVAVGEGQTRVSVRLGEFFHFCQIQVSAAGLKSLEISVAETSFHHGQELELAALATYCLADGGEELRNITHLVEWAVTPPKMLQAIDEHQGLFRAQNEGAFEVVAHWEEMASQVLALKIEPACVETLECRLPSSLMALGQQLRPEAWACYSNGQESLWSRDDKSIELTITGDACLEWDGDTLCAVAPGRAQIAWQSDWGKSQSLDVQCFIESFQSLEMVLPKMLRVQDRYPLCLELKLTDDQILDVTAYSHFESDNPSVATVKGHRIKTLQPGFATIKATCDQHQRSFLIQVLSGEDFAKQQKKRKKVHDIRALATRNPLPVGMNTALKIYAVSQHEGQDEFEELENTSPEIVNLSSALIYVRGRRIEALKPGQAEVMVQCLGQRAVAALHVIPPQPIRLRFSCQELNLEVGESWSCQVLALSSDHQEQEVKDGLTFRHSSSLVFDQDSQLLSASKVGRHSLEAQWQDLKCRLVVTVKPAQHAHHDKEEIGDYQRGAMIGEGGMGRVFRCHHRHSGEVFAMKIIKKNHARSSQSSKRFLREAKVLSQLNHPNVVKVFHYGRLAEAPYLVMELLEGQNLRDVLKVQGKLPLNTSIEVIKRVARALHRAHTQQPLIIHRDIKPSNLFVTQGGDIKLMDFGLTKMMDEVPEATVDGTRLSRPLGTCRYMAPEQAREPAKAGPLADIYALGITFFQCVSGKLPFYGQTEVEILMKHLQAPPPLLSQYLEDIPEALSQFVNQMLAKDPQKRPDAGAVVLELEKYEGQDDLKCLLDKPDQG